MDQSGGDIELGGCQHQILTVIRHLRPSELVERDERL